MKIRDDILNFIKPASSETKSPGNSKLQSNSSIDMDSSMGATNTSKTEKILTENNIEFSDGDIDAIDKFLNEGEGTEDEKIEAIKVASSKNVDMTFKNLNNINEALRENVDVEKIMNIISSIEKTGIQIPENIKIAIENFIDYAEHNVIISDELSAELLNNLESLLNVESPTEDIAEEFMEKVLESMAGKIELGERFLDTGDNEEYEFDSGSVDKERDDEDSYDIIKDYIERALSDIESIENEILTSSDAFKFDNLKMYVVKETTEKTIELKMEFDKYKSDILKRLEPLEKYSSESMNQNERETAKTIVNGTIDKIDNMIMKSDITLFTDMKTEKNLLSYSSDLADAKSFLEKGNFSKAMEIVKKVVKGIKEMKFDPSFKKIQAFEVKKIHNAFDLERNFERDYFKNVFSSYEREHDVSARKVLELFRSMGLNHEYELTEKIGNLKELKNQLKLEPNMKAILMKLSEEEKEDKNIVETIEKTLNNLNGQQLMNKQGNKNSNETMFFNIPIYSENEFKNMKLYINSREQNNKLDWENCDLYFVINFKEYGETGIKVDIKNRNLKITIKNDSDRLESEMLPLLQSVENEFSNAGFNIGDINFREMNFSKKSNEISSEKNIYDKIDEKGFDFKI